MRKLTYLFISILVIGFACEGPEGPEGPAGEQGNANVDVYMFQSPTWDANSFMDLSLAAITTTVSAEWLVLGYLEDSNWYPADGEFYGGSYRSYHYTGGMTIKCENFDGGVNTNPPTISRAKIILIEPDTTIFISGNGRMASPKQQLLDEMKDKGVNLDDYYQVARYFGIKE